MGMYEVSATTRGAVMADVTPIESATQARERQRREEETALLVRVRDQQDRAAFDRIYEAFAPRISAYIRSLGIASAGPDSLAQDVMLSVWTKAHLFDPEKSSARTWIYTLARNRFIDSKRADQRQAKAFDRIREHDVAADSGEAAPNFVETSGVAELLKHMPPEQSEVLVLAYVEGYSHREIAERLEVSVGTIKSRARLAFKKLRDQMGVQV